MLNNDDRNEYFGDDHAVIPKDRKTKGSFLPGIASWQLRKITGKALNEAPSGLSKTLIEMSPEGETEYALLKHYYKLQGIDYEFPNPRNISEKEKKEILAFREQGLTFKKISEKVGRNEKAIREVINDFRKIMEIKNDQRRMAVSEEEKKIILALRKQGLSFEKIAEKTGRDELTVTKRVKILEEEGLVAPSRYCKPLTEKQKGEILTLREQGLGYKEITEKTGRSKASISRIVKANENSPLFFSSLSFEFFKTKLVLVNKGSFEKASELKFGSLKIFVLCDV